MARKLEEANRKRQERISKKKSGKNKKKDIVADAGENDAEVLAEDITTRVDLDNEEPPVVEDSLEDDFDGKDAEKQVVIPKKKILILVQTAQGLIHKSCSASLTNLASLDSIDFQILFYEAEEGFCNAMNEAATYASIARFDKLLHISGGISFDVDSILKVINSEKHLIGAVCPQRGLPYKADFIPKKRDIEFFKDGKSIKSLMLAAEEVSEDGCIMVESISKSCFSIDLSLIDYFVSIDNKYRPDSFIFPTNDWNVIVDIFKPYMVGSSKLMNMRSFSRRCLDAGFKIYLDTSIILADSFIVK
jgi:hypothetical protein